MRRTAAVKIDQGIGKVEIQPENQSVPRKPAPSTFQLPFSGDFRFHFCYHLCQQLFTLFLTVSVDVPGVLFAVRKPLVSSSFRAFLFRENDAFRPIHSTNSVRFFPRVGQVVGQQQNEYSLPILSSLRGCPDGKQKRKYTLLH